MLRKNKHKKLDDLHEAVEKNDIKAAENCDLDCNLNDWNKKGQTPLHVAINNGCTEMVEFLIAKGADVNARNKKGLAPLHTAILSKHKPTAMAEILLESEHINLYLKMITWAESSRDRRYLTLDEFALLHEKPLIAELIDKKMRQERLNQEVSLNQLSELKIMLKSLEEKIQSTIPAAEKEKVSEKSVVSMFGFRPGSK